MTLAQPVRLSVTAVAEMVRLLELGSPQVVLQPTATWEQPERQTTADPSVWAEFAEVGLVDRPGRLSADAVATLAVLGQASVEYFGWLSTDSGRSGGVLVAASGQEAVYAVRRRDRVRLASIAPTGLIETFVDSLSGPSPARIDAVNIRTDDLHGVGQTPAIDGLLPALSASSRDTAAVRALLARPVTGLGELYVAARDRRGRYRVGEEPIRYRDTDTGRVMIIVSDDHVSIAPGTNAVLTERLRQASRAVTG